MVAGTALSTTQLNATANVPGAFVYTPGEGTVLPAGHHTLSTEFTPADTTTYAPRTATVTLNVKPDNVPIINVRPPLKIGTNDPLAAAMFQPTADVRGAFSFSPSPGMRLPLGTNAVEVTFTPSNNVFTTVSTNVFIVVVPFVPEGTVWTFSDAADRLRPLCGDDALTYYDTNDTGWPNTKIAFGTAASFGLPLPTGGDTEVMRFSHTLATEGFKLTFNDPPNGVYL